MKSFLRLLFCGVLMLSLGACESIFRRTPMTTTTTTTAKQGFGAAAGEGAVTTTVSKPYDPFAEDAGAAGKEMFSHPIQ